MKAKLAFRLALVILLVLAVAMVRVVKSIDTERYRTQLAAWTKAETGRELTFAGSVKFRASLRPALVANDVILSNRAGAARQDMIRLDHVEAEIGLLALFWGEVRVDRVQVDGADILLEQDAQGRGNWEFSAEPGIGPVANLPAAAIRVTQIVFRRVALHLPDPSGRALEIDRATLDTDGLANPVALTLDGAWGGRHLSVTGRLGSLRDIFVDEKPLALRLKALMPGLVASAEGTLRTDPRLGLAVSMSMTAELNDSADLNPLIGLPLPPLGSARGAFTVSGPLARPSITSVEATIGRHDSLAVSIKGSIADPLAGTGIDLALSIDGDAASAFGFGGQGASLPMALSGHVGASGKDEDKSWRIADLKGTLGRSDISGQIGVGRHAGHAVVEGKFDSALLDLTMPRRPNTETDRLLPLEGRVFSDDPLPTQMLMASDGHIAWRVTKLVDRKLSVGAVALDLDWHEGKLTALGAAGSIAGGRVEGKIEADARTSPPSLGVDLAVGHFSVGDFLLALGLSDAVQGGRVDFKLKSSGTGSSVRELVASQEGVSLLSVGPVQIASRLTEEGIGAILGRLATGSGDRAEMRCLISHFTLADGLARSEALLFAAGAQTVTGQGSINLVSETLDFTLTPRTAGEKASTPLDVGGTLLHPAVALDRGAIVKNIPGIAGDAASPLMSLAAEGNPCFAALAQGKRSVRPVAGGLR
jgi:hypothetical protein